MDDHPFRRDTAVWRSQLRRVTPRIAYRLGLHRKATHRATPEESHTRESAYPGYRAMPIGRRFGGNVPGRRNRVKDG